MIIGKKKVEVKDPLNPTELELLNIQLHGGQKAIEATKALLRENLTEVNLNSPDIQPRTPEEAEEFRIAEGFVQDQLEEGWEILRAEAEEALALNPNDTTAAGQMLAYKSWKYKRGTTITRKKSTEKYAHWVNTKTYGYLLRCTKGAHPGDIVNVRLRGGETKKKRLLDEVQKSYFRAIDVY